MISSMFLVIPQNAVLNHLSCSECTEFDFKFLGGCKPCLCSVSLTYFGCSFPVNHRLYVY
jgi:hypothetical protein